MTTDFDVRLEGAIRPLVTERLPQSLILDLESVGVDVRSRPFVRRVNQPLAIAAVLAALALATFALFLSVGRPTPQFTALQIAVANAKGAPLLVTADGPVYLARTDDATHLQLLLQPQTGDAVLLASLADPEPVSLSPSLTWDPVVCPPSTGLHQALYVVGNADQMTGPVFLKGIRGQTAGVSQKMYLIAIDASSVPAGKWSFSITEPWATRGEFTGNIWTPLVADGGRRLTRSAAGCLYEE